VSTSESERLYGAEHVRRYRETDGEVGHVWKEGATVLLLTTTGRKSGEKHTFPLIYGLDGDTPVVVASKGGASRHPIWYLNLRAHPEAEVQILGERFRVRAHEAEGEERERLWALMNELWPHYEQYQRRTDRRIPVVVLERV
jgi:deazaflavin-dependent oxidoreductase (nitroreductase family)